MLQECLCPRLNLPGFIQNQLRHAEGATAGESNKEIFPMKKHYCWTIGLLSGLASCGMQRSRVDLQRRKTNPEGPIFFQTVCVKFTTTASLSYSFQRFHPRPYHPQLTALHSFPY